MPNIKQVLTTNPDIANYTVTKHELWRNNPEVESTPPILWQNDNEP